MEGKTLKTTLVSFALRGIFAVVLAAGSLLATPPGRVSADTLVVTENDDHLHSGGVVGPCNSGDCTLREAIWEANASNLTPDTIVFDTSLAGATITLNNYIDITSPISISGTGVGITITGDGDDHLFSVGGTLSLEDLTLTGGRADAAGGAIINQNGTVNLTRTTFNNNLAANSTSGVGGAIYNHGSLTINRSVFTSNSASAINGGGAIYTDTGSVTITDSTFSNNSGSIGGAINVFGGSVSMTGSTVNANSAVSNGAGIHLAAGGSLSITNSTITGNSVSMGSGGGIYSLGSLVINFTTITDNLVSASAGGGISAPVSGFATITNSIVARNDGSGGRSNCDASFDSSSTNLADDASCGSGFTNSSTIGLGTLSDNGGETLTIPISSTSSASGVANNCVSTDQRGLGRTSTCDIGAFEYDGLPTISIQDATRTEGDIGDSRSLGFRVQLSAPAPSGGVTFQFGTSNDTATVADNDYTQVSGTRTITAGNTSVSISVPVIGDNYYELDETMHIGIDVISGAIEVDGSAIGTITNDDDAPSLTISNGNRTVEDYQHDFSVCFSGQTKLSATVNYATANDTAIAGSDYTSRSGSFTFNNGDPCQIISVPIAADSRYEPDEYYYVNLSNPVHAQISDGQGLGTINDNDPPPTVSISDLTLAEGASGTMTVSLSSSSGYNTIFSYRMNNGSAMSGSDYTSATAQLTIPAGSYSVTVPVTTLEDSIYEGNEAFTVELYSVSRATEDDGEGQVTITDNDSPPTISITNETIREGGEGIFTISLSSPSGLDTTFDYFTSDEEAVANEDYQPISGSLTIPAGDLTVTLQVIANSDAEAEADETFHLNVNNVVGATPTALDGIGTIIRPGLFITDSQATEGDTITFTVSLSAPTGLPVTFDYTTANGTAAAPADFAAASGNGTIPANSPGTTVVINTVEDTSYEPDETFVVNLTNGGNADILDSQATGTIYDDDATADLSVAISDSPDPVLAGSNLTYGITVSNNGPDPAGNITLSGDLSAGTTFVSLSAGAWSCTSPAVGTSGTVTCTLSSMASGASSNISLTAQSAETLVNGSTLTQMVMVSSTTNDPEAANGSATTATTVQSRPLVVTDPADSITYNTATLHGQVDPLGSSTSATFQYGLTSAYGAAVAASDPGSGTSYVPVSASLTGLSPATTYHYRVLATNSNGTTYGEDQTFTTNSLPNLSINDVTLAEGDSGTSTYTFTVSLTSAAPAGGVTFDIATANNTATTADVDYVAKTLTGQTIPSGSSIYTFNVTVNGDQIQEGNETFFVNITNVTGATVADGQGQGTITNDDAAGFTINPTSGLTTSEAGGTATFTVVLNSQPMADVTINLTSSDTTEGTVPLTSLVFTPADWDGALTVTITGVDDAMVDGDIAYTIQTANAISADPNFNNLDPADVSVSNQDDDSPEAALTTVIHNTAHAVITEAAVGDPVHASATVNGNGADTPTGEVTFSYYHNVSCGGTATGSVTVALDASGAADMTTSIALTGDGLSFAADYGGDSTYPAADGACTAISTSAFPTVLLHSVNTVPHEGQVFTNSINSVTVQFNMDVFHTSNSNQHSATYPGNYRLLGPGADAVFNTSVATGCLDGVAGDDVYYTITTISYNATSYVATIGINNGVQLPAGTYRLYACGSTSITDPIETIELNNGQDSTINFSIQASNTGGSTKKSVATGFAPDVITRLPEQPAELAYTTSELWIEIPDLGIQQPIVGIPQTDTGWDVSWLGDRIGYLQGTAFPTWAGNSVLTGHVTGADGRPGVFADLGNLRWGNQIIIHAYGQKYIYEVRTVSLWSNPDSTRVIEKHEELPWLTLITCRGYDEKTGTYRWRTVVRAVQVSVEEEN